MHRFSSLFALSGTRKRQNDKLDNMYADADDDDCNEEAKRGRSHSHRAAVERTYQPFAKKSAETKKEMVNQMATIAVMLDQRRIVPKDEEQHRQLIERELSTLDSKGPASLSTFRPLAGVENMQTPGSLHLVQLKNNQTGQYDLLEFADMLSKNGGTMKSEDKKRSAKIHKGIHSHESRQTVFKSLAHKDAFLTRFKEDDLFVYKLFSESGAAFASLLATPQHNSAEIWLEQFRLEKECRSASVTQWVEDALSGCGLLFFCAYVSQKDDNRICLLFSADSSDRYFLVLVASLTEKRTNKTVIDMAKNWDKDAQEEYKKRINDTNKARETLKPCCSNLDDSGDSRFWAIYNLEMCVSFAQINITFQYSYYTACQCVDLS